MTSNLGTRFAEKDTPLGFQKVSSQTNYKKIKDSMLDELKRAFNPEFLNRIDDTVVFHQLEKEHLVKIVDLLVTELNKQLIDQDLAIELTEEAVDWLIEKNYQQSYGARPMRRAIQRHIEDPLSEEILRGNLKDVKKARVVLQNNALHFVDSDVEALVSSNN
jgi:ATP-dependent Clp protease ATP-binding subunit ClpC